MNTKPFNLRQALAGHPVCTRDLRPARILCYDRDDGYTKDGIVALVTDINHCEYPYIYDRDGMLYPGDGESADDLVFPLVKKQGWINIIWDRELEITETDTNIFDSEEEAKKHAAFRPSEDRIATMKIEWEE